MPQSFALKSPSEVDLIDSGQRTAFGALRVAAAITLYDSVSEYDVTPLLWETTLTGGATSTHLPNESTVRLRVATANADKVVRQSRAYFRYQPGKSQYIRMTALYGAAVADVRRRMGYFDAANGIFLEQTGSGLSIVRRTFTSGAAVDNAVAQASWSFDPLTGTGPSGLTLDITKTFHLVIDFEWLGVGRVRVGFDFGTGEIIWAHYFVSPNSLTVPYMTTANLPLRYEIENTAAQGSAHDLNAVCVMVASEQGQETERGYPFSAGNGITAIAVGARVPILSIRPKATFNSIVNRGTIIPESVDVNATSGSVYVELIYNGTLTGAAFASVDGSSITEFDVTASAIANGIRIYSFTASSGAALVGAGTLASFLSRLPLTLDIAGANPIPLSVVATAFTGAVDTRAQLNWRELR
jgi:hypothetical protein